MEGSTPYGWSNAPEQPPADPERMSSVVRDSLKKALAPEEVGTSDLAPIVFGGGGEDQPPVDAGPTLTPPVNVLGSVLQQPDVGPLSSSGSSSSKGASEHGSQSGSVGAGSASASSSSSSSGKSHSVGSEAASNSVTGTGTAAVSKSASHSATSSSASGSSSSSSNSESDERKPFKVPAQLGLPTESSTRHSTSASVSGSDEQLISVRPTAEPQPAALPDSKWLSERPMAAPEAIPGPLPVVAEQPVLKERPMAEPEVAAAPLPVFSEQPALKERPMAEPEFPAPLPASHEEPSERPMTELDSLLAPLPAVVRIEAPHEITSGSGTLRGPLVEQPPVPRSSVLATQPPIAEPAKQPPVGGQPPVVQSPPGAVYDLVAEEAFEVLDQAIEDVSAEPLELVQRPKSIISQPPLDAAPVRVAATEGPKKEEESRRLSTMPVYKEPPATTDYVPPQFDRASVQMQPVQLPTCTCCGLGIPGMRYACTECFKYELCPPCHMAGRKTQYHMPYHLVEAIQPGGQPTSGNRRPRNVQEILYKYVVRGADWIWENQDGNGIGRVVRICTENPGWVEVIWIVDQTLARSHRWGLGGSIDLLVLDPQPDPSLIPIPGLEPNVPFPALSTPSAIATLRLGPASAVMNASQRMAPATAPEIANQRAQPVAGPVVGQKPPEKTQAPPRKPKGKRHFMWGPDHPKFTPLEMPMSLQNALHVRALDIMNLRRKSWRRNMLLIAFFAAIFAAGTAIASWLFEESRSNHNGNFNTGSIAVAALTICAAVLSLAFTIFAAGSVRYWISQPAFIANVILAVISLALKIAIAPLIAVIAANGYLDFALACIAFVLDIVCYFIVMVYMTRKFSVLQVPLVQVHT